MGVFAIAVDWFNCNYDYFSNLTATVQVAEDFCHVPAFVELSAREECGVAVIHINYGIALPAGFIVFGQEDVNFTGSILRASYLQAIVGMKKSSRVSVVMEPGNLTAFCKLLAHKKRSCTKLVMKLAVVGVYLATEQ